MSNLEDIVTTEDKQVQSKVDYALGRLKIASRFIFYFNRFTMHRYIPNAKVKLLNTRSTALHYVV